jgi:hypothetical protein
MREHRPLRAPVEDLFRFHRIAMDVVTLPWVISGGGARL